MKKKECRYSHKLNAYADGELSKNEFEEIQKHLKSCSACQQNLREITNLSSFLDKYEEEEVPEYLNQRILATVQEMETKHYWFGKRIVSFSIAASMAISFLIGILLADVTYQKSFPDNSTTASSSVFNFGEETLYSFFEGEE
ncbi:MAG: zf-HC2 domain-containing protein [Candidatus Cloacimonetes bacterium]|nr:zf-HC2 domain-containing protein [Candidatus Cloacimonadota bacterium]MCF7813180.1 zf-HC2 domain-containing protein [Candidatus Cloacimonadota bacterium]MCF7867628.1 zf-HC2 domain-containing protein [Candidatus Cloacimonadota bacterium]MCF7883097.1 zf-HC2 domain-containing protein [Candidatus Cloacimonadota bacterium]